MPEDQKSSPQSKSELEVHLQEQLGFLQSSADGFDSGKESEAKRMATALRVLLHDTKQSYSLLGQLSQKNKLFYNSRRPETPGNVLTYSGLTSITMSAKGTKYSAPLDEIPIAFKKTPFGEWWEEIIFRDNQKHAFSRKAVVLHLANQDGGAHVDPDLDKDHADLSRNNSLGWMETINGKTEPMRRPDLSAVRQIAHEVLKTLLPDYTKNPPSVTSGSLILMDSVLSSTPVNLPFPAVAINQSYRSTKVGRNEKCPCGSGKKHKRCCGS